MQNLIETIIHYLVIVSIINIIMNGLPIPYLSNRLHQKSFLINFSNRFEYQRKRECAGYATAFFRDKEKTIMYMKYIMKHTKGAYD